MHSPLPSRQFQGVLGFSLKYNIENLLNILEENHLYYQLFQL